MRLQSHPHPGTSRQPRLGKGPCVVSPKGARGGQTAGPRLTPVLPVTEGSPRQVAQVGAFCLPSPALAEDLLAEPLGSEDDFWGPLGPVATKVVDEERSLYR